jgi:hypothetical protein
VTVRKTRQNVSQKPTMLEMIELHYFYIFGMYVLLVILNTIFRP